MILLVGISLSGCVLNATSPGKQYERGSNAIPARQVVEHLRRSLHHARR